MHASEPSSGDRGSQRGFRCTEIPGPSVGSRQGGPENLIGLRSVRCASIILPLCVMSGEVLDMLKRSDSAAWYERPCTARPQAVRPSQLFPWGSCSPGVSITGWGCGEELTNTARVSERWFSCNAAGAEPVCSFSQASQGYFTGRALFARTVPGTVSPGVTGTDRTPAPGRFRHTCEPGRCLRPHPPHTAVVLARASLQWSAFIFL